MFCANCEQQTWHHQERLLLDTSSRQFIDVRRWRFSEKTSALSKTFVHCKRNASAHSFRTTYSPPYVQTGVLFKHTSHSNKPSTLIHKRDFIGVVLAGPIGGQASKCKYNKCNEERFCSMQICDYKHMPVFIYDPIIKYTEGWSLLCWPMQ
uniref:Uncharacterized protein n=1 Tax=Parascaris univalens TaxID=6257 RepID=A0A915ABY0_PARUN